MDDGNKSKSMVEKLFTNNIIKSQDVISVMKHVDRGNYVRHNPYMDMDSPQYICNTNIAALMVGDQGKAIGIDHIPELVDVSRSNPSKDGKDGLLTSGQIELVEGDGRKGWSQSGPYTAIHVGAAAPMSQDQLAPVGRMVIPVGPDGGDQSLYQVDKGLQGNVMRSRIVGVRYVPLREVDSEGDNDDGDDSDRGDKDSDGEDLPVSVRRKRKEMKKKVSLKDRK